MRNDEQKKLLLERVNVRVKGQSGTKDLTEKETAKKTIKSIVTKLKIKGILNFGSEAKAGSSGKNSS